MKAIEEFYGIRKHKKYSIKKFERKSVRAKKRFEAEQMVKEASILYSKGNFLQALSLLERAVVNMPTDHKVFYLTGLIHEELGNYQKSLNGFFVSAMLSNATKSNKYIWNRVYSLADTLNDHTKLLTAINSMYKINKSLPLLEKKMEILKSVKADIYSKICVKIDMMEYNDVDLSIFDKLKDYNSQERLKKVTRHLFKLIKSNKKAHFEEFLLKSLFIIYKAREFETFFSVYTNFYAPLAENINDNVLLQFYIASLHNNYNKIAQNTLQTDRNDLNINNRFLLIYKSHFESKLEQLKWQQVDQQHFIELIDFFEIRKLYEIAVKICENFCEFDKNLKISVKLAELYFKSGKLEISTNIYKQLLIEYPTNLEIKAKLYENYSKAGNKVLANIYKQKFDFYEFVTKPKELKNPTNSKMQENRNILEELQRENIGEIHFYEKAKTILGEFFNNEFVTDKNDTTFNIDNVKITKKLAQKTNKEGVCSKTNAKKILNYFGENSIENSLSDFSEENENYFIRDKRSVRKQNILMSCLHGLDVDEWYWVIKNTIVSLLINHKYQDAVEIIEKYLETHIWAENLTGIDFISIKACLFNNEIDLCCKIIFYLVSKTNYSAINLLFFCCTFLNDYYKNDNLIKILKNVQKAYFRRKEGSGLEIKNEEEILSNQLEFSCERRKLSSEEKEALYSDQLFLNSFFPRYSYIQTIERLFKATNKNNTVNKLLLGIIQINHSKSRIIADQKEFARKGLLLLEEIEKDGVLDENITKDVITYNLAKSYQFLGYQLQAEKMYLKVIKSKNITIKRMAIFNLSLICRRNKSKKFLKQLYNCYYNS
ncbi:TAU like transcription factor [Nucleospora cyclopteri]